MNALETLAAIDRLTCNCPCMSAEAERAFERCPDAAAYKAALAGVILKIRELARAAIPEAEPLCIPPGPGPTQNRLVRWSKRMGVWLCLSDSTKTNALTLVPFNEVARATLTPNEQRIGVIAPAAEVSIR